MAKLIGPFQFTGKLQDYSAYTRKDVEGIILRKSGGADAQKIATDPAFARTRENNHEFGGASTSAKLFRLAMSAVVPLADSSLTGRTTALCNSIIRLADTGTRGTRPLTFSAFRNLIESFNPNLKKPFTAIVKQEVIGTIVREHLTGTVILPDLIPKVNFLPPASMPRFRFLITLGAITDMIHDHGVYSRVNSDIGLFEAAKVETPWFPTTKKFTGFSVDIVANNLNINETCTLMLSIGIQFGKMGEDDTITPVNTQGAVKILRAV